MGSRANTFMDEPIATVVNTVGEETGELSGAERIALSIATQAHS